MEDPDSGWLRSLLHADSPKEYKLTGPAKDES